MDPGAVADVSKGQHSQLFAAETLQAALAALLPGAAGGAAQVLHLPPQPLQTQSVQIQLEQCSNAKQLSKRKATRASVEEPTSSGPPRPPPIKHEVYEDLEEKFNQLQSEREPKRHRGNPKGYQIKSFCKNPACGKQLNGGRTNRCEHCGFDLASHRRNSQLERLIKAGPLTHSQVRTSLRDAANEVHVRTGGKAVVLTLVFIDGGGPAPAQAIAYGKPAAAFVESRKELITTFEGACRAHFREQQVPGGPQQQQAQQPQLQDSIAGSDQLETPTLLGPQPAGTPAAAGSSTASAVAAVAARPCTLGPSSQLLSAVGAATAAAAAAAAATAGPVGVLQPGAPPALPLPLAAAAPSQPVDLDAVIGSVLSNPAAAIARCREARVSGEVLARLPQAMQLTVLMQAGLLPGEAASVVVELESRQRLQQLPAVSLATLSQQLLQQQQQHQHQQPHGTAPALQQAAAIVTPQPQPAAAMLPVPHPPVALPAAHGAESAAAVAPTQQWGAGALGSDAGPAGTVAGVLCMAAGAGGGNPVAYHHPVGSGGGGLLPGGGTASAVAAAVPLLGPLQAALMAAAAMSVGGAADAGGAAAVVPTSSQNQQQLEGLLAAAHGGPMSAAGMPGFGGSHLGVHAAVQLPASHPGQLPPPQL